MRFPTWLRLTLLVAIIILVRAEDDTEGVASVDRSKDCTPLEVHLAFTSRLDEMKVMWRTKADNCATWVDYGQALTSGVAAGATLQARGSSHKFTEDVMCASPAKQRPFKSIVHSVVLANLAEDSRYWYRVTGEGESTTFLSRRAVRPDARFTFLALGDTGEGRIKARKSPMAVVTLDAVLRDVEDRTIDFVMHIGDLAYAEGSHKTWDSFMDMISPVARQVPYMIGVGNHEYDYHGNADNDASGASAAYHPSWGNYGHDSGGECGAMTARRFSMPDIDLDNPAAAAAAAAAAGSSVNKPVAAETGGKWAARLLKGLGLGGGGVAAGWHVLASLEGTSSRSSGAAAFISTSGGNVGDVAGAGVATMSATAAGLSAGAGSNQAASQAEDVDDDGNPNEWWSGGRASNAPFWYSFEQGSVHMTVISTEHDLSWGSRQWRWLRHDLKSVDRCSTPWVIVALHRPMYVVFPHKDNRVVGEHIRDFIEDLLFKYKVDLTIAGHVHSYYRSCSVYRGFCRSDGVVHAVVGTGGHLLSNAEDDQATWLDKFIGDWGYTRLDVDPHRLKVEFVHSDTGAVGDRFRLTPQINVAEECRDGRRGYSATRDVPPPEPPAPAVAPALNDNDVTDGSDEYAVDHADDSEYEDYSVPGGGGSEDSADVHVIAKDGDDAKEAESA